MPLRKLHPFTNVVASGTATASLANLLGLSVDRIVLQLGGTTFTKAMITGVRVLANAKKIYEDTGSRIDARQTYRGLPAAANFLVIDFSEPKARSIVGEKMGSLDTVSGGIATLTMEVDIAGATAPTLVGWADLSEPQVGADAAVLIGKVITTTQNIAAAGKFPFDPGIGRRTPTICKRLHFFSGNISAVEVLRGGIPVFEDVPDALNDFMQTEYGRTPGTNLYTVDFLMKGNQSDALSLDPAIGWQCNVTTTAGGNITCVAEILDPLANN